MRAGRMRETLIFLELKETQTPSGAVKKEWTEVYKCRAMYKRASPVYDKDGVNAKELFRGDNIYMIVRMADAVNDLLRVKHNGIMYEIIPPIEPNYTDRTLQIQIRRYNE